MNGFAVAALAAMTACWGYWGSGAAEAAPAQHDLMASVYQSLAPTAALSRELLEEKGYLSLADIQQLNDVLEGEVRPDVPTKLKEGR